MRILAGTLILTLAATASARPGGISGASGKAGFFCNQCHSGGATPTVTLQGPSSLSPGQQATYTFTISGGAAVAGGLDAALDDDALAAGARLATVSTLTKLLDGEITHSQPNDFSGGALSFQLSVIAPATPRTMTLYAAGNSTNHDGSNSGDRAAATTLAITVAGTPPPPPPPPPPASTGDLGDATDLAASASDLMSAPPPSGPDMTTPAGDSGSAEPPAGRSSSSGCSAAPGAAAGDMPALAAALGLAWAFSRRRRALSASASRPR